ncbi:threonine--tRNA ligase [Fimbriimonas ginsengisoli]|uniref:Threonine--tRNA ligase n=1 Tax=Fimbriimonas ginsengisoli Gsoil 348 TaxID=661478 RepID=A0A068NYK0_FIMGI|nr:threonine--tRNA ligase [Fimbriimonas ginsengisoli]AIE87014.1 threonyl-tRNA synthetase [Fimbriimonas ginsengisoli Gsoil 348]
MAAQAYEQSYLYRLRHSAAHLLAQAVTELYPGAKLSIGPPVENGFYYDIDFPTPLREEDLPKIEQRMKELAKLDQRIECKPVDREEAKRLILDDTVPGMGAAVAEYKLQLLDAIPAGDQITFYDQQRTDREGKFHRFLDLCRGPHVDSTKEIKNFKLMNLAGAYWRGDVKNKQLTRIYGTAFETKEELESYLIMLEEAKKRDHRLLGRELGLFMFSPRVGTGLPLWLPKGAMLRQVMIDFLQKEQVKRGYDPVVTPQIASIKLYEKSGHIITFKEKLFPFMEDEEKETYILKPMNCPFHIEIYQSQMRSYRDLPIRYAEFGTVHRYEQSGEVTGILRARGFTQDDAHLFVRPDQLEEEFIAVVELTKRVLDKLGLHDFRARVGTKDPASDKYIGHDDNWTAATNAITGACEKMGMEYFVSPGDAAFYGPKLDLIIKDALGRDWQMGTIQVDYNLPERFELEYIGEDSKPHRPIMIHRAPFGSLERMIGLLTEQYAGAFPFWLSPVQIAILPIADRHNDRAAELASELKEMIYDTRNLRVTVDDRRETLGKKIRENQLQKVPYMLILGDRDLENGTVGVRSREEGDLGAMSLEDFIARL